MSRAVEDPLDLEDDERRRSLDQRSQRVGAVALDQVGGIGALGQRHDAQLELARLRQPRRAQHRLLPRPVGVQAQLEHADDALELPTCSSVSEVPMIPTALLSPAWCSASTSV